MRKALLTAQVTLLSHGVRISVSSIKVGSRHTIHSLVETALDGPDGM